MSAIPWFLAVLLWLPVAFAGALGFVPIVGILGISALFFPKVLELRPYMWSFAACFVYAAITSVWSPYTTPLVEINFSEGDYHVKSAVLRVALIALFGGLALAGAHKISSRNSKAIIWGFVVIACLQMLVLVIIRHFYDEMYALLEPLITDNASAVMNLSRNVSSFGVGSIILIAVLREFGKVSSGAGIFLSGVLALAIAFYCQALSASAAAIGIVLAWLFMFLPQLLGKYTFRVLGGVSAAFIVVSPLCFSFLIAELGESKELLSPSFLWRVEIWSEVISKTSDAPIWGRGLDALRTFDAVFQDGPWEGERIVPLHAHNMLLHIWVETGFIGVCLTALSVGLLGNRIPAPSELGPSAASAACGLWAACLVVCTLSFSVWNDWWWALIVVAVGLVTLLRNAWIEEVE